MGLPIRIETRTGDTPVSKRTRQRRDPPDILLTTPEQLALLLASADAPYLFGTLKRVILDELHALVTSKRGDLLSLGLARLFRLAPGLHTIGLSATVAEPDDLRRYLVPQPRDGERLADLVIAQPGAEPDVTMLEPDARDPDSYIPWAGHSARHAYPQIYDLIKQHKTTLVFVNTRSQAERIFQELWRINDDGLAIALHHGSLDVAQRRKVEDAMAAASCARWSAPPRSISASTGATSISSSMSARRRARRGCCSGSAAPITGWTSPRAAFWCRPIASKCWNAAPRSKRSATMRRIRRRLRTGALDVLAQHVLGTACGEPFDADVLYDEVTSAAPYRELTRADFDATIDFVATGGYALKAYERFAKIKQDKAGRWRVTHPRFAQAYRMNVGTIVEAVMLKVRLVRSRGGASGRTGPIGRGGRMLGQVEEYFAETLALGDTFVFAGEVLRYEAMVEDELYVSRATDDDPKVPSYEGGKFPLSTYLASRVRNILATPSEWKALPEPVREWLEIQERRSVLPGPRELLVETFPRADKHYLVCYPFEGRLAHQTLGMLLTRRLERARLRPLGFVANEYALAVWGLGDVAQTRPARGTLARGTVRRGHAGRRPGSLARRVDDDEADLPHQCGDRGPDPAPLHRPGEDPPAGHDLDRPDL